MDSIILNNIRTYSYHGCLQEETKIGSDYLIDLKVNVNLDKSSKTDKLPHTLDYVYLNKVVIEEMSQPSALLESVARRIINRIFKEKKAVKKILVLISKLNPPIGGDVEKVTIKMTDKRKKKSSY